MSCDKKYIRYVLKDTNDNYKQYGGDLNAQPCSEKKYIRVVLKDDYEQFGGVPIIGQKRITNALVKVQPVTPQIDINKSLSGPLTEMPSVISSALKEMRCCLNDMKLFKADNLQQKSYLEVSVADYEAFVNNVSKIAQPVDYKVIINLDNVKETQSELDSKILSVVKPIYIAYIDFVKKFIEDLKKKNLPQYKISLEYKRAETCEIGPGKSCCDKTIEPNSCMSQFANQKLVRITLPLEEFGKRFKEFVHGKDGKLGNLGQYENKRNEITNFYAHVETKLKELKEYMNQINELQRTLDNRHKDALDQLKRNKKAFTDKYGEINIPYPQKPSVISNLRSSFKSVFTK